MFSNALAIDEHQRGRLRLLFEVRKVYEPADSAFTNADAICSLNIVAAVENGHQAPVVPLFHLPGEWMVVALGTVNLLALYDWGYRLRDGLIVVVSLS